MEQNVRFGLTELNAMFCNMHVKQEPNRTRFGVAELTDTFCGVHANPEWLKTHSINDYLKQNYQ